MFDVWTGVEFRCLDGCFFDVFVFEWVLNSVGCLDSAKDL